MKDRLAAFLNAENISQAQFAAVLGVGTPNISHLLAGRNKPSYDFIVSLMQNYPSLNIDWLLTGTGTMYRKGGNVPKKAPEDEENTLFSSQDNNPDRYFDDELFGMEQLSAPQAPVQTRPSGRKVAKVMVFFTDGTYQELK
ncbi:MAG: helix-turn-helix transcriptional regulator [Bacteroidales bacterium]|nr:helix-turn-helix transcriptional regulator [Bacteroidales bacterium]